MGKKKQFRDEFPWIFWPGRAGVSPADHHGAFGDHGETPGPAFDWNILRRLLGHIVIHEQAELMWIQAEKKLTGCNGSILPSVEKAAGDVALLLCLCIPPFRSWPRFDRGDGSWDISRSAQTFVVRSQLWRCATLQQLMLRSTSQRTTCRRPSKSLPGILCAAFQWIYKLHAWTLMETITDKTSSCEHPAYVAMLISEELGRLDKKRDRHVEDVYKLRRKTVAPRLKTTVISDIRNFQRDLRLKISNYLCLFP